MDPVLAIILMSFAMVAATGLRMWYYSSPKTFAWGDETFRWIPGKKSWREWKHGSFEYSDGSEVTDRALVECLREEWTRRNRPRGY